MVLKHGLTAYTAIQRQALNSYGPLSPAAYPEDPENWDPLSLNELKQLLDGVSKPWWVAGGTAIDLHVGRSTRAHHDLDIMIFRNHCTDFQDALEGWDLRIPTGKWVGPPNESPALFVPWPDRLMLGDWAGQVWCRRALHEKWSLELLISPGDGSMWTFKHDPSITRSLSDIGGTSDYGIPYLLPEIVLLHKARSAYVGEFADADLESCIPSMDSQAVDWLREMIQRVAPQHHWLERLRAR